MLGKFIKVCGLRDPDNIREIFDLSPDFAGFIFFPGSKRFVADPRTLTWINDLSDKPTITGVFVNQSLSDIHRVMEELELDALQLHGHESPEYCHNLKRQGMLVIKSFGIHKDFRWSILEPYDDAVDMFLFDTASVQFGGTGKSFDWTLLDGYLGAAPFFLSGGIGPGMRVWPKNPSFIGIDLNSRFELHPGMKDVQLLKSFMNEFRDDN